MDPAQRVMQPIIQDFQHDKYVIQIVGYILEQERQVRIAAVKEEDGQAGTSSTDLASKGKDDIEKKAIEDREEEIRTAFQRLVLDRYVERSMPCDLPQRPPPAFAKLVASIFSTKAEKFHWISKSSWKMTRNTSVPRRTCKWVFRLSCQSHNGLRYLSCYTSK